MAAENEQFIIEDGVLLECRSDDKEIIIPEGVTTISRDAFTTYWYEKEDDTRCEAVKIHLPDSLKVIEDGAFYALEELEEINIPDGVTVISKCAFELCGSLKEIVLPPSVKEIQEGAFLECVSLKNMCVPDTVEKIGMMAFDGCPYITKPASEVQIERQKRGVCLRCGGEMKHKNGLFRSYDRCVRCRNKRFLNSGRMSRKKEAKKDETT